MPPPVLRLAVGILLCAPLLAVANGTAPAAAAVSMMPAAAAPSPAPAAPVDLPPSPAAAPVSSALPPPAPVQVGTGATPAAADSSAVVLAVGVAPAAPPGWLPFVPVYAVPVWPAQPPLPVPIQPDPALGGVAYVLMWVPVPLASAPSAAVAGSPPAQSGVLPSAAASMPIHTPEAPAPLISVETTGETARAVAVAPSLTVSTQNVAAASADATEVRASRTPLPPKVDYGPVAPTPVVYLGRRAGAAAVRPARASAAAGAPAQRATRPAPKRRMCWIEGVVAPCR